MSWYPDMGTASMVAKGDHVRAVGWLSSQNPFSTGDVSREFVSRLREFICMAYESSDALHFPAFAGLHTCELCGNDRDGRDFGVPTESVLFVAPGMIAHYIEVHSYQPPSEFVSAVLAAPLPNTEEYNLLAAPFRQMHDAYWDRKHQEHIDAAGLRAFQNGGTEEAISMVASTMFGASYPEICEQIRKSMPQA